MKIKIGIPDLWLKLKACNLFHAIRDLAVYLRSEIFPAGDCHLQKQGHIILRCLARKAKRSQYTWSLQSGR